MKKEDIIKIVLGLGYAFSESEYSQNGSLYDRYEKLGCPNIWIGNYFLEIETQPHLFPWRDKDSTIKQVLNFLN